MESDIYNQAVVKSTHSALYGVTTTLEQHLPSWRQYLDSSELRYESVHLTNMPSRPSFGLVPCANRSISIS
jgi:hypothetical protein